MGDIKKTIVELLMNKGITQEEAEVESEKRIKKIESLYTNKNILANIPLLHESAFTCLNCGRNVLIGKCCENTTYCKDEDRYIDYKVSPTEYENIFSVDMNGEIYFIQKERDNVYGLTLFHTAEQAKKDFERG